MAHSRPDFESVEALKAAVDAGQAVTLFSNPLVGVTPVQNGLEWVHGPYNGDAEPHKQWFALVEVHNGIVQDVIQPKLPNVILGDGLDHYDELELELFEDDGNPNHEPDLGEYIPPGESIPHYLEVAG